MILDGLIEIFENLKKTVIKPAQTLVQELYIPYLMLVYNFPNYELVIKKLTRLKYLRARARQSASLQLSFSHSLLKFYNVISIDFFRLKVCIQRLKSADLYETLSKFYPG